jgi:ABC-type dipeptide/oligopeptide/nickel transport system permease component
MLAYAIRRVLWAIPTLFGISLVVFLLTTLIEVPVQTEQDRFDPGSVLSQEDRARARFIDLPRFFNPQPQDIRGRTDEIVFHLVADDEQRDLAAARLARIGGAALPFIIPAMDRMPAAAKSRVAVALAPMAVRMGQGDAVSLRDPASAPIFWTRYWEEHSTDFTEPSVRRTVDRLLVRDSAQRENDLAEVDTFALATVIDAMARVQDRPALRRLMVVAAHASGRGLVPDTDASPETFTRAKEDWRSWWFIHRSDYIAYDGATKVAASVTDTRYGRWMLGAVTSQLGLSTRDGVPISEKLYARAPVTFALTFIAMLASYLVAIPVGVLSAWRRGKAVDATFALLLLLVYSVPVFVLAQALSGLFARDNLLGLAVPILALTAGGAAALSRHQRSSMTEVLSLDYVRTARAKGVSELRVLVVHALRNAIVSTTTLAGLQFPLMLGSTFVVEEVFGIQGLGWETLRAIETHDAAWLVAVVLFSAVMTMVTLIASDVVTSVLDPRSRDRDLRTGDA